MRVLCIAVLGAACGSAPGATGAPVAPGAPVAAGTPHRAAAPDEDLDTPPVDALVELARETFEVGWIAPREVVLESRGAAIYPVVGTPPQHVQILERHGHDLRIGLRLETARFALWTDTSGLLGTIKADAHVSSHAGGDAMFGDDPPDVVLRPGARVTVLGRDKTWVHVRYLGALEVEGWVPAAAVGDRAPAGDREGYTPTGWRTLNVMPGTAIRVEPRWGTRLLAVMGHGYFLDDVKDLGEGRHEVRYRDGDVRVHGFVAMHDPPEAVHGRRDEAPAPAPPTPTPDPVASGTCLYGHVRGEPIGFIFGDAQVALEDGTGSWFTITLDTPWGPMTFAAQGASRTELVACAPPNSVPPSTLKSAPASVP